MDSQLQPHTSSSAPSGKRPDATWASVWLSTLLRYGVLASALIVFAGGIIYLLANSQAPFSMTEFTAQAPYLTRVNSILSNSLALDSRALIQAGLLLLILTPIARVILSVVIFMLERDRLYVIITLIVISLLLYTLLGDIAG